jgi:hypothetical protein
LTTPPFAAASAYGVLLDGIVAALCGHGDSTSAERDARASGIRALVAAEQPRDALEMMLLGQCLLFHEVIAAAGRDLLRGSTEALKLRAQSNLNGLNRSLRQSLDALRKARDKTDAAAEAPKRRAEPAKKPAAARVDAASPAEAVPEAKTPWLDEPQVAGVIETPAAEVARLLAEKRDAGEGAAPAEEPRGLHDDPAIEQRVLALYRAARAERARGGLVPEVVDTG